VQKTRGGVLGANNIGEQIKIKSLPIHPAERKGVSEKKEQILDTPLGDIKSKRDAEKTEKEFT